MMEKIKGTQLGKWLLHDLTKITDLIYFEGPLLSHFKNNDGDNYLFYWCDSDERHNRWLVFRVIEKQLRNYFDKKISLRELMLELSDGFLYSVDINDELQYENVYMMVPQDLPESYLPLSDSYYDFELSLANAQEQEEQRNYAIGIDKRWTLHDLPKFLNVYSQVYSFIYSHLVGDESDNSERLKYAYTSQPWKGGWSTVNFFRYFTQSVPELSITSMQYASPGWIELELFNPAALAIKGHIGAFIESADEIIELYKQIRKELKQRKLTKDVDVRKLDLDKETTLVIQGLTQNLANLLAFDSVEQINKLTGSPLATLKILMSFYRRIQRLAEYQIRGMAEY